MLKSESDKNIHKTGCEPIVCPSNPNLLLIANDIICN